MGTVGCVWAIKAKEAVEITAPDESVRTVLPVDGEAQYVLMMPGIHTAKVGEKTQKIEAN